jgi:hypothetical protein
MVKSASMQIEKDEVEIRQRTFREGLVSIKATLQ